MKTDTFITQCELSPEQIDGQRCLAQLMMEMALGLEGKGNIPMIPSYLPLSVTPMTGRPCCIMDAGGTNLRFARAEFDEEGRCRISGLRKTAMPGTRKVLGFRQFYGELAQYARETGCTERVGLCFSFNVLLERQLDGILHSWCKEVRVPEAPGKPVGASLQAALGSRCRYVRVLNDSTAALLGAHYEDPRVRVGLILGTGINLCYSQSCSGIPKVPTDLKGDHMIISTEIGEFQGIPKTCFDREVIASTDEPEMAHGEKQCAGAYLGLLITKAWQAAVRDGLLPEAFLKPESLPRISDYLAGEDVGIPNHPAARKIARTMIHRAAKIAAILTAGPVLRSCGPGENCTIVVEGSQFSRLTGFAGSFRRELQELLMPWDVTFSITQVENSCLIGAALAAFAEPM